MMHLANLLTVSECGDVRRQAGQTLLLFAGCLSADQRNEVAVELLKGLELGENEFAKYIPEYLGPLILLQEPREADEFLESLESMFLHANESDCRQSPGYSRRDDRELPGLSGEFC